MNFATIWTNLIRIKIYLTLARPSTTCNMMAHTWYFRFQQVNMNITPYSEPMYWVLLSNPTRSQCTGSYYQTLLRANVLGPTIKPYVLGPTIKPYSEPMYWVLLSNPTHRPFLWSCSVSEHPACDHMTIT